MKPLKHNITIASPADAVRSVREANNRVSQSLQVRFGLAQHLFVYALFADRLHACETAECRARFHRLSGIGKVRDALLRVGNGFFDPFPEDGLLLGGHTERL